MAQLMNCDYAHFPRAEQTVPEMKELVANKDLYGCAMAGNVVYAEREGSPPLHLQILYPLYPKYAENQQTDFPCIVHVHGSGWRKQDLYRRIPALSSLAEKGYVIALAEYRPSITAPFPAQIQDVKAAVRWLRLNAFTYNGDPQKIAIMGDSSGGHTALLSVLTQGKTLFEPNLYPGVADDLCGCLDLYGPTNLQTMPDQPSVMDHEAADSPEGVLLGGRALSQIPPSELELTSAKHWIMPRMSLPRFMILHGDKDDTVPFAQSVEVYTALRNAGADVTFYKVRNAGHGGPEFWTPQMINLYNSFFKRCFGN